MKRRRSILLIILIIVIVIGLYQAFHGGFKIGDSRQRKAEIAKKEILAAGKAFAERCGKEGMASAFTAFADLGYTYGHYTYTTVDSTGKRIIYKGIFHSVWKKRDGVWKFVWDN